MMGSIVTTVAAERTVTGVTTAVAVLPPVVALPLCCMTEERSFINSYCRVVYWVFIRLYNIASNQEFHCPTATNRATVAYTGLHRGEMIRVKMVKSLARQSWRILPARWADLP